MEEVRHETATSWVAAMDQSHELLQGDDPKRRMLGFYDHTDEKHHTITCAKVSGTGVALPREQRRLLATPKNRRKFIEGE